MLLKHTQLHLVLKTHVQIDLSEMSVFTQKMNIIDVIVNNLASHSSDVGCKLG
ncbi:hypothetical protein [Candidatus Liberibacter asiaticus]|uniref:hypothetical protein n=1 Tax=Liberibacter asiaticus TaxID=34021 RepID=UPI0012ED20E7|nr:hypothetical protein [Candidatus Liberibacter asiaticus]